MANKNYWCYRINKEEIDFFWNELNEGRLRQGWGWLKGQDLRNFKKDRGAGKNFPMFRNVKKYDILLVLELPSKGYVAIVEATEDWDIGYRFEIHEAMGDFGHIFPAKFLRYFSRHNENVTGNIRSTLKNPSRFWNINHFKNDVEKLLNEDQTKLEKSHGYKNRLESSIGNILKDLKQLLSNIGKTIEKILVSMKQSKKYELTKKDINLILRLNYRGWKNMEIARAFNISESEIKYVLENK